jgi:hypothetical protein
MIEGVNSTMIYCKKFCKCGNIPTKPHDHLNRHRKNIGKHLFHDKYCQKNRYRYREEHPKLDEVQVKKYTDNIIFNNPMNGCNI